MASKNVSFSFVKVLLSAGRAFALPHIRSKTLGKALNSYISGGRGYLNVPHYWAWYVHEGRGPVRVVKSKYLVWFKNPKEDPRLSAGYPVTKSQAERRRLTLSSSQFTYLRKAGRIIVTKGPTGPISEPKKNPFFSNSGGMRGFADRANGIMKKEVHNAFIRELKSRKVLNVTVRGTVVI